MTRSVELGGFRARLCVLLPLLAVLLVRVPFLVGAWNTSFVGDEPQYLRLGRAWAEQGTYTGQWPPLFPAFVALAYECFGDGGARAVRVALTLLSVAVAAALMGLAREVSGPRAARLVGWLYALHLPLVPYAHMAKSETLFLLFLVPALTLLARAGREREAASRWLLPLVGLCLGLSSLTREAGLVVLVLCAPWVALVTRTRLRDGVRAAFVVVTAAALVIAPWTARNLFAYGKVVPLSTTTGTNAYLGLNGLYTNFDLVRLAEPNPSNVAGSALRAWLLADAPEPWPRRTDGNHASRDAQHVRDGFAFATAHPAYIARTRLLRLADFFTPLSYAVKYQRLGTYGPPFESVLARASVAWLAVIQVLALGVVTILGYAAARFTAAGRSLLLVAAAALTLPGLVVALSRFRAPLEAVALVVVAALLAGPREVAPPRRRAFALVAFAVLVLCWIISLPPTVASLEAIR
jgi:4-amino-4-deoxy-L-arabinose transferase-like glycosyltransferase